MLTWFALFAVRVYRRYLSRYTPHCAQKPICSTYALRVIKKHGARKGLHMTRIRIQNCGKEHHG